MDDSITIPASISLDEDEYFDRLCPFIECGKMFKVLWDDWQEKVQDDAAYCPFCRHQSDPSDFNTAEQSTYFGELALAEVQRQLDRMLGRMTRGFNRKLPKSGPITMTWSFSSRSVSFPLPPDAEEAMTVRIVCESCGCQFAVIGDGFFCPACGHNSVTQWLGSAIAIVRKTMRVLNIVRSAIPDPNDAEQVAQKTIEGQIGEIVTIFQYFAETHYPDLPSFSAPARQNAFQNLDEGNRLWAAAGGTSYDSVLSPHEWKEIQKFFQQRHVLEHRRGVVDQKYVQKTGDKTYSPGQRLVIRESAILRFADLVEKLTNGMRADVSVPVSVPLNNALPASEAPEMPGLRVVGLMDSDLALFKLICDRALATGDSEIFGETLRTLASDSGLTRQQLQDSIEMLASKRLIQADWPIGRDLLPALISLTLYGRETLLRQTVANYSLVRQRVAKEIADGATATSTIREKLDQPKLVIDHIVADFGNRDWLDTREIGNEIYLADPTVEIRRLAEKADSRAAGSLA